MTTANQTVAHETLPIVYDVPSQRTDEKAAMLQRLLVFRFGSLPETSARRLRTASDAQLDAWLSHILTAQSREEVLDA